MGYLFVCLFVCLFIALILLSGSGLNKQQDATVLQENRSINQSVSQSVSQSTNQPINPSNLSICDARMVVISAGTADDPGVG